VCGPLAHERRNVSRYHRGAGLTGDANRRGRDAAANVEDPILRPETRPGEQLVGGGPPAGMDHPLAQHREKRVWIQGMDLLGRQSLRHHGLRQHVQVVA